MEDFAGLLAFLGLLTASGLAVTKGVDLIRNALDRGDTAPKFVWNVAALVVGVGMFVLWPQDVNLAAAGVSLIPKLAPLADELQTTTGQIISGLLAGGAAGFGHEFLDRLSGAARLRHAEAAKLENGG
jgi:hypothetical protein